MATIVSPPSNTWKAVARASAERTTLKDALECYLAEVTSTKKPSTQAAERQKTKTLNQRLGQCGLAQLTPERVAEYHDECLAEPRARAPAPCVWRWPCLVIYTAPPPANGVWASCAIRSQCSAA